MVFYTDHWEEYICAVTSLLQRRWKQLSEHLVCEVSLENVWVIPRVMSRAKERPDQTPGSAGKGSKAGKRELLISFAFYSQCFKFAYLLHTNCTFVNKPRSWGGFWICGAQNTIGDVSQGMCREGDNPHWPVRIRKDTADVLFRTTMGTQTSRFTTFCVF